MLKDGVAVARNRSVKRAFSCRGEFLAAVRLRLKQSLGGHPRAPTIHIHEECLAPIFVRRDVRQAVITTATEEALEEEVVLDGLSVFGHIPGCLIGARQRFADVLARRDAIDVWSECLIQTLVNLLNG